MRSLHRFTAGLSLLLVALVLATATSGASATAAQAKAVAAAGPGAVGALFTLTSNGTLGDHFCTGTVVHSGAGNVVLTAAHCLNGHTPGSFAFVPAYRSGTAPLGVWVVEKVFVDSAWASSSDPDHDFAFLVVAHRGSRASLEALTGAERLGAGVSVGKLATVVGYPESDDVAIGCKSLLVDLSSTQLQFACDGYTDGTSGSALVVDPDPVTGLGTVVGVIGGYQQGGDTAAISYAAAFSANAEALYREVLEAS